MAQHTVLILNQAVPQIQEPQVGDSYLMVRDVEIQGNLVISGTVDGRDVAADGALLDTAVQSGDNLSVLVNDILASQVEAEAGIDNTKLMTPLRVAQALAALDQDILNNFSALTDPLATDDSGDGYAVGSMWANTSTGSVFVCTDATVNVAVWTEVTDVELASQAEAEAGTNNTKTMTPLRVAQAIAVFSAGLLNKYDGVADPIGTNDVNDGYSVGSIWMNQASNEVFRCIDNSAGTAIWIKTSLTIDELATVAVSGDSDDLVEGAVKLLMTAAERSKLTGIEAGATADQSAAEIRAAVEAATDSNVFTDADHSKLDGIEALADVTDAVNVEAAGALMDSELTDLIGVKALDTSTLQVKPTEGAFVDGDKTKLDGIETGATADQTGAEIKSAYEGEADTNAYTDAAKSKVDWLEGVTGAITAFATGGQASATALTTRFNVVTTVASVGDSVKLPAAAAGLQVTVANQGASAMDLFPASGDAIDGGSVDAAVSVPSGDSVTVWALDATNWYYA
jgi:hypothetical protein